LLAKFLVAYGQPSPKLSIGFNMPSKNLYASNVHLTGTAY